MRSVQESSGRRSGSPRPADWVLAALVVVLMLFGPVTGQSDATSTAWSGTAATVLAAGQGLALVWRRRYPVAVAACVLGCYAGLSLTAGLVPPFACWVLVWSTGSNLDEGRGSVELAGVTALGTGLLVLLAELTRPGAGASALLVLITLAVALGALVLRTERARMEAVRRRAQDEERLRIARELHDLVGHGLSVIAVQSSTARMALDAEDAETARTAMNAVESSSRTAMREMRQMLGVLGSAAGDTTGEDQSVAPAPRIPDIATLVDNLRAGGMMVGLLMKGRLDDIAPAVQLCAYRVVQEALTNAIKQSPGASAEVCVNADGETLLVAVTSSFGGPTESAVEGSGTGLEGLRVRVDALGGEFRAEPSAEGWRVEARLPLSQEDS
jgi:signal transduction histidine kinase